MDTRYFYHSFPRRKVNDDPTATIEKGCQLLTSIRDLGLLLVPEQIEWKQPHADGLPPRIVRILQKRVCFTELAPDELPKHAETFGEFALEFDIDVVRGLGALPVFYLPDPNTNAVDGSALGAAFIAIMQDVQSLVHRIRFLQNFIDNATPDITKHAFTTTVTGNADFRNTATLDIAEAKNLIAWLGNGLTPFDPMHGGLTALPNFFYPADNRVKDGLLDYYRQREWRIAYGFNLLGQEVCRQVTDADREKILKIDKEFFTKTIDSDYGPVERLGQSLILSGLKGKSLIEMVRRVIVPIEALDKAKSILAEIDNPPQVIGLNKL